MKAKRFTEEQIIGILKEAERTGNIREACKRSNITETTFYRWRSSFGGMEVYLSRSDLTVIPVAHRLSDRVGSVGNLVSVSHTVQP